MIKKPLPIDDLKDGLENSPFFKRHSQPSPASHNQAEPSLTTQPAEPTARRTDRTTGRRTPIRRGFEFYEDQLIALKKLSLQEQLEGKPGNMSQMVRQALDDFLAKQTDRKL